MRQATGLAVALATLVATGAGAQVLQIGPDGGVTTFSGPAVFTRDQVVPLDPPSRPGARTRRASVTAPDVRPAAQAARLSPALVEAVAWRESRLRPDAVSAKGAVGEMQLMPATARALGVDPADPRQNLRGGAAYLSALMRRYDGDLLRSLAAYNAGSGAVDRYGGVPPYRETQAYVAAVLDRLSQAVAPQGAGEARR